MAFQNTGFQNALVIIQEYWEIHGDAAVNIGNSIRIGVDQLEEQKKGAIKESVETISKAIKLLAHGEGVDIFCGILMVLSGVATLNPTTGPIVGSVLKLASAVIHNFCGNGDRVGNAVLRSINQALEQFADAELRAKVSGTVQVYKTSFAFLSVGNPALIRNDEVATIMTNVPIYAGVEFLGILQHKIENLKDCTDKKEAFRAIEYINMYVKLAILRNSLIQSLYNIVAQTVGGENIAERIRNVITTEQDTDRTLLSFLARPEDYDHKLLLSCMYISTMPNLGNYLQHLGVERRKVTGFRIFSFTTGGFTIGLTRAWFFNPLNDGFMGSMDDHKAEYSFQLEVISEVDNLFYIRSVKEPRVYIYLENSPFAQCSASKSPPGPKGEWKVIKFRDGGHIFSTKRWPEWFLKGDQEDNRPTMDSPYSSDTINYTLKGSNRDYSIFFL